jgi:lysophospholipase L1-like esterase
LPRLSGFGDSVLLDARAELGRLFRGGTIDALIGRQPADILGDVIKAARAGRIAPVVVLHAGDNGLIDPAQLTRALGDLSSARVVLVLNLHLDPYADPWQRPNNATIQRVVPKFRNAHIVDWDALAGAHRDWLYPDGIHLTPDGAIGYARMVAAAARQYL